MEQPENTGEIEQDATNSVKVARHATSEVYEGLPATTKKKILAPLAEHRPEAWAKSIAARTGKSLSAEHKAKLSESHRKTNRERPPARKVSLWAVAEDTLLGLTTTASAKKRDGWQADVYRTRRAMGLPTRYPGTFRHGEVLTYRHFEDLCEDIGFTKKEGAPLAGLSYRGFSNRIKKKGRDAPLSGPKPSDPS